MANVMGQEGQKGGAHGEQGEDRRPPLPQTIRAQERAIEVNKIIKETGFGRRAARKIAQKRHGER